MHFILEKQLKKLVGNIKLSSVTAENNWVFCPVACDFCVVCEAAAGQASERRAAEGARGLSGVRTCSPEF